MIKADMGKFKEDWEVDEHHILGDSEGGRAYTMVDCRFCRLKFHSAEDLGCHMEDKHCMSSQFAGVRPKKEGHRGYIASRCLECDKCFLTPPDYEHHMEQMHNGPKRAREAARFDAIRLEELTNRMNHGDNYFCLHDKPKPPKEPEVK